MGHLLDDGVGDSDWDDPLVGESMMPRKDATGFREHKCPGREDGVEIIEVLGANDAQYENGPWLEAGWNLLITGGYWSVGPISYCPFCGIALKRTVSADA